MKLGGALTEVERDGTHLLCGGGARLPSAAGKTPTWGLSGLEFGINIPGTVGGAVRMNANAYGGQLAEVLEWVEVSTATGTERRTPDAFDFVYRNSNLTEGEIVSRASFALTPGDPEEIHATLASMRGPPPRGAALRDQDLRLDLQEPRRPARRGPLRRAAARGGRVPRPRGRRRPLLREARELRREHGGGDDRRRARADGRGPPPGEGEVRGRARARGPGARRRRGPGVGVVIGRGRSPVEAAGADPADRLPRRSRSSRSPSTGSACAAPRPRAPRRSTPRVVAQIGNGKR